MLTLDNFSGGLWIADQAQFTMPANALLIADNLEYLPSGAIRGRRGRAKYNASLLAGSVLSLWRHYPRSGTPATLAAFVNGANVDFKHDTIGDGTFSAVTGGTGFTAATRWHFANWPSKNKTFLANGSNTMRSYNGVIADMGATPKKGPYLTVWQSMLWATEPTELNYSVYASDVDDETVWPAANHLNVSDPQGGLITGLAPWQDQLIILKSTGLWRFYGEIGFGGNLAQYSDIGCTSPETVQVTPYGILFVGRQGVYITDGTQAGTREISNPISPVFVFPSSQGVFSGAIGIWFARRDQFWFTFTAGFLPTFIATRNPNSNASPRWPWANYSGLAMNCACVWDSEAEDGRLLIGDTTGQVWTADTGTTDDGTAIATTTKLAARFLDPEFQRFGRVTAVKTLHRGSVPLSGVIEYDASGLSDVTFTSGVASAASIKNVRSKLWDFSKQGRYFAVSLANPSDSYNYELYRLDLDTRLRQIRRWP